MNDLRVNSKTTIAEFKRKHNFLVENSAIKLDVSNIVSLTDDELNNLKCGDIVVKKTGNQKHNYIVTYKEEKHGICLSYYAAGYLETVSYDYTNGHWVYNSTDIFNMAEIPEGTIDKVLGLNSSGNFVKGVLYNFLGDIPVTIQTNYPYHITINVSDKPTKNGIYRLYTLENNIKQYYGIVEYTFDESNSYYVGMFKGKVFSGS